MCSWLTGKHPAQNVAEGSHKFKPLHTKEKNKSTTAFQRAFLPCGHIFCMNFINMAYQSAIISCDHISNSNSSLLYFISVAGAVLLKRLWLRNTGNTKIKI